MRRRIFAGAMPSSVRAARLEPGQHQHHPVVAVVQRLLHGHRIGDAAVIVRHPVDHVRLAGHRHRGRGLDDIEVVVMHVGLVEVLGGPVLGIARDHGEPGGVLLERRVVDRVFAVMVAQRAVDVIQIGEIVVLHIAVEARVFLAERVFGVELVVAAVLLGDERHHIRASGRNAVAVVECDAVLQTAVHHARAENRAETPAHIDQCRPMRRTAHRNPFPAVESELTRAVGTKIGRCSATLRETVQIFRK